MPDFERVVQKLEQYVNRRMQAACTPGMVIALTDREKLLQVSAYGVTDVAAEMPVTLIHSSRSVPSTVSIMGRALSPVA